MNSTEPAVHTAVASASGAGTSDFIAVLTYSATFFTIFVVMFLSLRMCYPEIYTANKEVVKKAFAKYNDEEEKEEEEEEEETGVGLPEVGIFWNVFAADHKLVLDIAGLDAYMFVETLWLCFMILVWMTPVAIVAGCVYATDPKSHEKDLLRMMSLGNVSSEQRGRSVVGLAMLLWSSLVMVYKFRSAFMRNAVFVEKHHLTDNQEKYSVMVSRVDNHEQLKNEVGSMYDNQGSVHCCRGVADLLPKYQALKAAEEVEDSLNAGEEPGCCTTPADVKTNREAAEKEFFGDNGQTVVEKLEMTQTTILTFPTVRQALEIGNGMLLPADGKVLARPCPFRDDILFGNLHTSENVKSLLRLVSVTCYALLIIFWSAIITFIQGLTSLDSLSKLMPFLKDITDGNPALKITIQGLLPVIVVSIAFMVLPIILWYLTSWTYPVCGTDLKSEVLVKYTHCFIGIGLLAASVSGAILKNIGGFAEGLSFKQMYELLGTQVPLVSTYFINIVVNAGLFGITLELSGIINVVMKYITGGKQGEMVYYIVYPYLVYIFTIVITYCTISPFMILWGLVFFLFAYWVYKHQLMYVYKLKKNTNAWQFWPKIYSLFHIGLYIGQFVVIGIFATKKAFVELGFTIAALFISLNVCSNAQFEFKPYFDFPSLLVADRFDQKGGLKRWSANFFYTDAEKRALGLIKRVDTNDSPIGVGTAETELLAPGIELKEKTSGEKRGTDQDGQFE